MSATQLMADLTRLGIQLEAHGDRLRYSPRSAVTPELVNQMREHKSALLAMAQTNPQMEESADELLDGLARCGCLLRLNEAGRLVMAGVPLDMASAVTNHEADLTRILKVEAASMAEAIDKIIDPPDACPKCGSLELWETLARSWRCQRCDPPTKARRHRERADRLRRSPR